MLTSQERIHKRIIRIWNYLYASRIGIVEGLDIYIEKVNGDKYLMYRDTLVCHNGSDTKSIKLVIDTKNKNAFIHIDNILKMFSEPVEDENTEKSYTIISEKLCIYETSVTKNAGVTIFIERLQ